MKGRDRMLTALRRGVPDAVPVWELIINEPVISALGYRSSEVRGDRPGRVQVRVGDRLEDELEQDPLPGERPHQGLSGS